MGNMGCACASAPKSPAPSPHPRSPGIQLNPAVKNSWVDEAPPASPLEASSLTNKANPADSLVQDLRSAPLVVVIPKKRGGRFFGRGLPRPLSAPIDTCRRSMEVLSLAPLLAHCGWRGIGMLAVSGAIGKKAITTEDVWRAVCEALGEEAALHVPTDMPLKGWRWLFWEHLWPARGKWVQSSADGSATAIAQGFKIRVAARFRPAKASGGEKRLVLPLHQRLKLMKKGEKLSFWGEQEQEQRNEAGLSVNELEKMVEGEQLNSEVLQALMEAQQLGNCCNEAKRDADGAKRRKWRKMSFGGIAGGEVQGEESEDIEQLPGAVDGDGPGGTRKRKSEDEVQTIEETAVEAKKRGARVLAVQESRVVLFVPGIGIRPFHFPAVFEKTNSQRDVYESTARDSVLSVLNGFNACLLCYGQTGSGKTYTVFGPAGVLESPVAFNGNLSPNCGIVIRACNEILSACNQTNKNLTLTATLQYVEIYQDSCTDLMTGNNVKIAGSNGSLQGAAEKSVDSIRDVVTVLRQGEERKKYAETAMNERSSRAHTVCIMHLSSYNKRTGTVVKSQLHMVDLAGCEQLKQSKVVGTRKVEAIGINSSLLVLGKCISALVESRSHVPYFESKLTTLLKSAFGGNSRTTAIITGSLDPDHGDQTFQALSFGERCSMITNSAKMAVTNIDGALASIDQAIEQCEHSIASLEERGKTHLASYSKVKERYQQMKQKRRELSKLTR